MKRFLTDHLTNAMLAYTYAPNAASRAAIAVALHYARTLGES